MWRWEDLAVGPRQIPSIHDLDKGKTKVANSTKISIDTKRSTVAMKDNSTTIDDVGQELIYKLKI